MAISFPYPTMGTTQRPKGEGCGSCVHRKYCDAFYWYYRYADNPSQTGKAGAVLDERLGTMCAEWSANEDDRITTRTDDDVAENAKRIQEDVLQEPFSSGIDDPVTAGRREH